MKTGQKMNRAEWLRERIEFYQRERDYQQGLVDRLEELYALRAQYPDDWETSEDDEIRAITWRRDPEGDLELCTRALIGYQRKLLLPECRVIGELVVDKGFPAGDPCWAAEMIGRFLVGW